MRGSSTPGMALAVTAALFLLAWLENTVLPWAPFYILYVAASIYLPLRWRTGRFGALRSVPVRHWLLAVACGVGAQVILSALALGALPQGLLAFGVTPEQLESPFWNLAAAHTALFAHWAAHWQIGIAEFQAAYLLFLVLWAGFGEEVYFRGYLHAAFASRWRVPAVVTVSALLFGVRHAVQFAGLAPQYPWGAAAIWSLYGALFGVILSWLYLRTGSLWPPILAHYLFNAVPLALGALSGSAS